MSWTNRNARYMCIDERVCSGTVREETEHWCMCISARRKHIQLNENFDRSSWDYKSLLCDMFMSLRLLCPGLVEDWVWSTIRQFLAACGLRRFREVLSLPLCMKAANQDMCEVTCCPVSNTKQHNCANPSILLAHTSSFRRNVCFTCKSTESYYLERQGQAQHWDMPVTSVADRPVRMYWNWEPVLKNFVQTLPLEPHPPL